MMGKTLCLKNDHVNALQIGTQLEVVGLEGNQILLEVKEKNAEESQRKRVDMNKWIEELREIIEEPLDLSNYTPVKRDEIYKELW
jgi:hypothetical protein